MMRTSAVVIAVSILSFSSFGHAQGLPPADPPPDWDQAMSMAEVEDLNPDPGIVEINLTAKVAEVEIAPGRRVQAWTYNGSLPGPLIRVRVGNRLIVHFTNELPKP